MHTLTMSKKLVTWEQQNKSTAAFQEDFKMKLTTLMTVNGNFPFGTAFVVEVLKKNKLTYSNYESMTPDVKKKYKS